MKLVYYAPEVETLHLASRTEILQASVDSLNAATLPALDRPDLGELW